MCSSMMHDVLNLSTAANKLAEGIRLCGVRPGLLNPTGVGHLQPDIGMASGWCASSLMLACTTVRYGMVVMQGWE